MSRGKPERPPNSAAAYVRMSTEHQQYSTSNQMDVIREYAKRRGLEIVKEYSDEGKSGLNIQGRDSLAQMLKDVQSGEATFSHILVYDVSRWGRFQDADESAHYEYTCRLAGVTVHYCAEQFENEGSPVSTIVKGVKRAMAGEYSRELSSKVFQGACRLIRLGYKQGGTAGFGLRRILIDQNGERKTMLKMGEHRDDLIKHQSPAQTRQAIRADVILAKDQENHRGESQQESPVAVMDIEAALLAERRPVEREPVKGELQPLIQHGQYQTGEEYDKLACCHGTCFRSLPIQVKGISICPDTENHQQPELEKSALKHR